MHDFIPDASGYGCDYTDNGRECPLPKGHPIHRAPTPVQAAQTPRQRDGATFRPTMDESRLNAQARRVWRFMADQGWHTLAEIAAGASSPEASVSARLRDFRKPEFGGHEVQRRSPNGGLSEYRLLVRVVSNA